MKQEERLIEISNETPNQLSQRGYEVVISRPLVLFEAVEAARGVYKTFKERVEHVMIIGKTYNKNRVYAKFTKRPEKMIVGVER